jgi:hypothetical protein
LKALVSRPYNAISMNSNSPVIPRIVLGVVVLMAIAIPVGMTLQDAGKLALMEKTAELADRSVTRKTCSNHGKVAYSYAVDGHAYKGVGNVRGIACSDVKVGDRIKIIYSAEKPQLSRLESLESWRAEVSGATIAIALISLGGVILIFHLTRVDVET